MCYKCNPINESLTLNEAKSLEWDLGEEFEKANRKYFDGKLKPVYMRYRRIKKPLGYVKVQKHITGGRVEYVKILELVISSSYNLNYKQFLEVFLHELCHLLMHQNYHDYHWRGGEHGEEWQALGKKIGDMAGVIIQQYTNFEDYTYGKVKPFVLYKKVYNNGEIVYGTSSLKVFEKTSEKLIIGRQPNIKSLEARKMDSEYIKKSLTSSRTPKIKFYGFRNDEKHDKFNDAFENGEPLEFNEFSETKVDLYILMVLELKAGGYGVSRYSVRNYLNKREELKRYIDHIKDLTRGKGGSSIEKIYVIKTDSPTFIKLGNSRKVSLSYYPVTRGQSMEEEVKDLIDNGNIIDEFDFDD